MLKERLREEHTCGVDQQVDVRVLRVDGLKQCRNALIRAQVGGDDSLLICTES